MSETRISPETSGQPAGIWLADRRDADRSAPGIIDRLRAEPATRVIAVHRGRVRIGPSALDGSASLETLAPSSIWEDPAVTSPIPALLGRDARGVTLLLAAYPASAVVPEEAAWASLREIGHLLGAEEASFAVSATALAAWLQDAPFCPGCGTRTEIVQAGWARRCPGCGQEHFPRTDPAVIVAVESVDGSRILLGANAAWGGQRYSCFAGFVEAGESLEQTVHREIREEAGVRLQAVRYLASQAWPYPRSLMVGFRAAAIDDGEARPDGEEIIDTRWFTRAEITRALAGEGPVGLPGPSSLAYRLIRDWLDR